MTKKYTGFLSLVLIGALSLALLAGCNSDSSSGKTAEADYSKWPQQPVTLSVSVAAGGGLDGMARILAPHLQKALPQGNSVVVDNMPGGSGWVSWESMMRGEPNGYTLVTTYTPQIFSYMNKKLKNARTLDDFSFLVNIVFDAATVCVAAEDARFANVATLQEFIDYLKANKDKTFRVGLTSAEGGDHLAMLELCKLAGITNLKEIYYSNIADAKAAFMGRQVDVYFGKVGDTLSMYQAKECKVFAVFNDARSRFMPNVPTAAEQGYKVVNGSARGFGVQKNMDPKLKKVIIDYITAAVKSPDFVADMNKAGYEVVFLAGDDYEKFMRDQENVVKQFADLLGYNR